MQKQAFALPKKRKNMKSLKDIELKNKRVLMRVDFNVPLKEGKITDDTRIRAALPSINYILEHNGKLILISHLGRPKGIVVPSMSLNPVAQKLSKIIGKQVKFMTESIGKDIEDASKSMNEGDVILLENTRFHPEEKKNDDSYAKELAKLGDVYVNDAFGTAHRAHSSVEGITHYFEEKTPGFLMEAEIKQLSRLLESPEKPFVALLGGAKISGKIDVIQNLLPKVDKILLGGGMVFTFFKAKGYEIGSSLMEEDKIPLAKKLLNNDKNKLVLPIDIAIGDKFDNNAKKMEVIASSMPIGWMGLDIGLKTSEEYAKIIEDAKTIFWNGPLGVFEFENFAGSTKALVRQLAERTKKGAITVIGGGDSIAAINKFGSANNVTHISTGGGASLEFLSGKKLPGIEALENQRT